MKVSVLKGFQKLIEYYKHNNALNLFQSSVAFYVETKVLICIENQMSGYYIKCNAEVKMDGNSYISPFTG